jgi:RNA polymerase sigma factor (sigma-70 family)
MSTQAPEALFARWRAQRDPEALGLLFDGAAPGLFRLALSLVPDAATAEDALQETFLFAMEEGDRWDPARPVVPWLAGILRLKVLEARRRNARAPRPERVPNPSAAGNPLDSAADAEERERVRVALLELEEPYREAALLRWRYGLEPAEIAEIKGVPPGTVSSWLHRAVEKMRVEMGALPAVMAVAFPERGLGVVKAQVLGGAATVAATGAGVGVGVAALATGGGIMAGKAVVGTAAVGVAALIAWWSLGGRGTEAPAPGKPPVQAPELPPAKSATMVPPAEAPKERPKETPAPADRTPATPAPEATVFDPASATATLRIRARAPEALPRMRPVKFDADPKCGEAHRGQEILEQTVVAKDGNLANVIVWVSKGAERWTYPAPEGPAVIDQKGCMYEPHVLTVRVGQPITIRNSDPVMHNIHALPKVNAEFNRSQLKGAMDITERFDREEVGVKFKCDVHGWMGAWAGVFTHPFHGVTDGEGMVEIRLPPGEYEVSAWHEFPKFGKPAPRPVTVAAGETKEIEFDFGVR